MNVLVNRRAVFGLGLAAVGGFARIAPAAERKRFAIALHGGAGRSAERTPPEERRKIEAALEQALGIGVALLDQGKPSLDAVEQVIRFLEDDPLFNAGRGAVLNAAGQHELDASIMDGRTLACGGVGAVRTVRHPISLARLVMEQTPHVLLVADGAEKFADQMQVERVENSWFTIDSRRRELERAQKQQPAPRKNAPAAKQAGRAQPAGASGVHGTVGCVALDAQGNLAAGTSTGGRTNKLPGRLGDSPIVGAGTYANNKSCAMSGTGLGEQFIRHAVGYDLSARMLYRQQPLEEAVREVLGQTLNPDDGGLIAIAAEGTIVMDFNSDGMARAAADSTGFREVKLGR